MELNLENKVALITGSTKGIGRAIVFELAKEGADVIINGRHENSVQATVLEIKEKYPNTTPRAAVFDLGKQKDISSLLEKFPTVDLLINSLGIFSPMDYFDLEKKDWEDIINVNVLASNELSKHYLPKMLEKNSGRIIFIASEGAVMPSPEMPHYSATKTMQLSLSRSLAELTKGTEVTVNTVMPGSSLTEGVEKMLDDLYGKQGLTLEEKERKFMKENRSTSIIQRLIHPEEIAHVVSFLSSPLSSAINGSALKIDGGLVPTIY